MTTPQRTAAYIRGLHHLSRDPRYRRGMQVAARIEARRRQPQDPLEACETYRVLGLIAQRERDR